MEHPRIRGLADWRPLARGGFAVVWEARQLSLDRLVAVKVYQRGLDEGDRRRLLGEAAAAGRLSGHPGVITAYDAGVLPDERPYLVMELCPDGSLSQWLKVENRPTEERVREVGVRVADALVAAHAAGVLHRDVKPANILMDRYGNPRLADFGLAAVIGDAAAPETLRVTLAYSPPEAFDKQQRPTDTGDVFSLAATLYALLAGSPPRRVGPAPVTVEQMVELAKRPVDPLPGVNWYLMEALLTALRHDPGARPTAAQFRDRLSEVPAPRSGRRDPLAAATGNRFGGLRRKHPVDPRRTSRSKDHSRAVTEVPAAAPRAADRPAADRPGRRDRRRWGLLALAAVLVTGIASGTAWLLEEPASSGVPPAATVSATSSPDPSSTGRSPESGPRSATTDSPGPDASSSSDTAAGKPFRLEDMSPTARPHETVRIHGTYRGRPDTFVWVQHWDQGTWQSFPLPTKTDGSGEFTAHVELGDTGRHRLRLLDPESGVTSKSFTVTIKD